MNLDKLEAIATDLASIGDTVMISKITDIKALIALARMQHEALSKWYSWDSGDEFKYSDHIEATYAALAAYERFNNGE